jgi:glutamine synthetase
MVALRVPGTPGKSRHFEHRVAGVDANPYLVAAVTLAGALQGIETKADPGPAVEPGDDNRKQANSLPNSWQNAIHRAGQSAFLREALGQTLHHGFVAVKQAEYERLALEVTEAEWDLYGFVV